MITKIKPSELDNKFFTIIGTNKSLFNISYVGFSQTPVLSNYQYISTKLLTTTFKTDTKLVMNEKSNYFNIINSEIKSRFIAEISKLSQQNRECNLETMDRLDIKIKDNNIDVSKNLLSKFISAGNFIATEGRIGSAQFMISNTTTYRYILKYLIGINHVYNNNILQIGHIEYHIDNSVEDGIILLGRKNNIDSSGVHCVILTDDDGYIRFDEINTPYENNIVIYFNIITIGDAQSQYLALKSRSISYYRSQKLKKINKSNEK